MRYWKLNKLMVSLLTLGVYASAQALMPTAVPAAAAPQAQKPATVKAAEVVAAKLGGEPIGPSLSDLEALNRKAEVAAAERTFKERMAAGQAGDAIAPPETPKPAAPAPRTPAPPPPPSSGAKLVSVIVVGGGASADIVLPSGARYMAKQGEILPGGWRVAAADMNGVVVEQAGGGAREVLPKYVPIALGVDAGVGAPVTVPPELRERLMRMPVGSPGQRPDSTAMSAQVPPLPR